MHIEISQFQNEFRLNAELLLPKKQEELFPFFSAAKNLELLTPPRMKFTVVTPEPIDMATDTVIDYKLQVRGLPLRWKSLISLWDPPYQFIDEQLKGPYHYWIHQHSFEEKGAGTMVRDHVRYQVFGGKLVHSLFVKPDLLKIFTFRQKKLLELFYPKMS